MIRFPQPHSIRWQIATGVIDVCGKFAAVVVDTDGKFAAGINDTSGIGGKFSAGAVPVVRLDLQISPRILKMALMLLSEAWGKMIHKKNRSKKSRDTVPLRRKRKAVLYP